MKYWTECECCGHKVVAHTHRLNKGLVQAFCFFRMVSRGEPANPNEMPLTHNQKANWQKLQYFGLVKRIEGGWIVTRDGDRWFRDKIGCWDLVATMGNRVLPLDHPARQTTKMRPNWVAISSIIERAEYLRYKSRQEYREEMPNVYRKNQPLLFGGVETKRSFTDLSPHERQDNQKNDPLHKN